MTPHLKVKRLCHESKASPELEREESKQCLSSRSETKLVEVDEHLK